MSDDAGRQSRPAFYAARPGGWRDWWTCSPPYTAWHLSYVVIGASLAPHVSLGRLVGTLLAFLFAVGLRRTRSTSCTGVHWAPASRLRR